MTDRYITLVDDSGIEETHAAADPGGNYATLCGNSADDTVFEVVPTPRGKRIDCEMCLRTYTEAKRFRRRDFE